MAKRKRTKIITMIHKTLYRKLKIEQHEYNKKPGLNQVLRNAKISSSRSTTVEPLKTDYVRGNEISRFSEVPVLGGSGNRCFRSQHWYRKYKILISWRLIMLYIHISNVHSIHTYIYYWTFEVTSSFGWFIGFSFRLAFLLIVLVFFT